LYIFTSGIMIVWRVHVCVYSSTHARTHNVFIPTHKTYAKTRACMHKNIRTYIRTFIKHTCTCMHIILDTPTHIYTRVHIHTFQNPHYRYTYGVASVSRIDTITGLLCWRAL